MKNTIYLLFFLSFTVSATIEDHKIYPIYETEAVRTSGDAADDPVSVSYTHLTLPTIYSV